MNSDWCLGHTVTLERRAPENDVAVSIGDSDREPIRRLRNGQPGIQNTKPPRERLREPVRSSCAHRATRARSTAAVFDPSSSYVVTGGTDATERRYVCDVCGNLGALVKLAEQRLAVTGRQLTSEEQPHG